MRKLALCLLLLCTSTALAQAPDADDPRETARIRLWLSHVEAFLRSRDVAHLPRAQRERRALNLQHLRAYWQAGRFPHNHHTEGLSPVFIDEHGTACAVGHLLLTGGAEALAWQVAREQLLVRLPELHSPALERWATANGFTLAELALIQPSYHNPPPEKRLCLRRVPTVLRYAEGGWEPVTGPLDTPEPQDGWELPWLGVSQEGELTLISRAGGVYTWGGLLFQKRMEKPARVTAALPMTKDEALLAIIPGSWKEASFVRTQEAVRDRYEVDNHPVRRKEDTFEHGPRPELLSLWAERGGGTVFGVGRNGVIVRRTPYESWVALESPAQAPLLDIDGTGAKDLWAVGGGGTVLHFDGEAWRRVDSGTQEGLIAVAAAAPDNVWAVGTRGTALHFDGTRWQRVETGVSSTLRAVAVTVDGAVLGGDEGVLLHRSGDQWVRQDVSTPDSIMSLVFAHDTLFATTNAQVSCNPQLHVMARRWIPSFFQGLESDTGLTYYTVPDLNGPLLALGRVQAFLLALTGIRLPITLSLLVLLGGPLALCVRARRRDSEREWPVGVGIALGLLLVGLLFMTARDRASYEFTLVQGAMNADMRSAELTRLQDWSLLGYDLRRPSVGSESRQGVTASWSTPATFIQNAGEPGNPRDVELRARYQRLLSTGDADPLKSLAQALPERALPE